MNKSGASSGVAARLLAKTRSHFEGILFNDRLSFGIIPADSRPRKNWSLDSRGRVKIADGLKLQ